MTPDVIDVIDTRGPVLLLCDLLSLDPARLASLHIKPGHIEAHVYTLNANGQKHLNDEGYIAMDRRLFKVRT